LENKSIDKVNIHRFKEGKIQEVEDELAVELPLEIQLATHGQRPAKSISVTMRTPGNDDELAIGFLFTEAIISDNNNIESFSYPAQNQIRIILEEGTKIQLDQLERHFYTSSSCGVCSKSSIEAIYTNTKFDLPVEQKLISRDQIHGFLQHVDNEQSLFNRTGGIHAAALFDFDGNLIALREDVGRHNALDKLIGYAINNQMLPLHKYVLFLSGRASFELIQKARMAAIPIVVAVGAPSSLAVELASDSGQTLIGFLKKNSLNIYCGHERIRI